MNEKSRIEQKYFLRFFRYAVVTWPFKKQFCYFLTISLSSTSQSCQSYARAYRLEDFSVLFSTTCDVLMSRLVVTSRPRGGLGSFQGLGPQYNYFFYDIWSACEYRLTCVVAKLNQFWVGENCLFVKKFYKKKLFTFC